MKYTIITAALLLAGATGVAGAQSSVRLQLEPGSYLTFTGTSTLHGFTCKTEKIEAYIDVDPAYRIKQLTEVPHPIVTTRVVIPVKSLKCGEGKLESNMYGTLKADQNPTIEYVLSSYEMVNGSTTASGFGANTTGKLTVAGTSNTVNMTISARRGEDGSASATGSYALKMTDFGIKPPKFMFGTLKVGNDVAIKFNLKASARAVAALEAGMLAER